MIKCALIIMLPLFALLSNDLNKNVYKEYFGRDNIDSSKGGLYGNKVIVDWKDSKSIVSEEPAVKTDDVINTTKSLDKLSHTGSNENVTNTTTTNNTVNNTTTTNNTTNNSTTTNKKFVTEEVVKKTIVSEIKNISTDVKKQQAATVNNSKNISTGDIQAENVNFDMHNEDNSAYDVKQEYQQYKQEQTQNVKNEHR